MEHLIIILIQIIVACILVWLALSAITVLYAMILNFYDDTYRFHCSLKKLANKPKQK